VAAAIGGYDVYSQYKEATKGMDNNEKADYIFGMDLTIQQKNRLVNSVFDRETPINLAGMENYPNFEEFDYATKNPKKYAASKFVGGLDAYKSYNEEISKITSGNDSNRSGVTDKSLVKEYIFNLDLDYGQKAILYRSLYDAKADKATYNRVILEYLESRSDVSWEDMKELLINLDFQVYDDGTIRW
jgi:hypothetical protein